MFITNIKTTLHEVLKKYVKAADEIIICSPFVSSTDILYEILDSEKVFELVLRLSYPATPSFLEQLLKYRENNNTIYVYDDNSLHAKIYLFKNHKKNLAAIIGSSNFTCSGITENKEINILLKNKIAPIDKYVDFIINNAYSELNKDVIEYYKTFYRKPKTPGRFKKTRINRKVVDEYKSILNRYNQIKGILKKQNKTSLPFTYVFDAFCHQFKINIIKDYGLKTSGADIQNKAMEYFSIFLKRYFNKAQITRRFDLYNRNKMIREKPSGVSSRLIKEFFLNIHSVNSGSGSGVRTEEIAKTDVRKLRSLLDFILYESIEMANKVSIYLTPPTKKGKRIRFLGESSIREIPGWLIPEQYPIINNKFLFVLDFLGF